MSITDAFVNEHGDRFALGTHDPQEALAAFQRLDRDAGHVHGPWVMRAEHVAAFEYGWYVRQEPPHPDCDVAYLPAEEGDTNAAPGIRFRA